MLGRFFVFSLNLIKILHDVSIQEIGIVTKKLVLFDLKSIIKIVSKKGSEIDEK